MTERPFEPGGFYHVGSRGNFGSPLFEQPAFPEIYLARFAQVARKYDWVTLDWCLLWNHTHFLIRLGDHGLSAGMRELNSWFARRLNLIHGQTGKGHVFRHNFFAEHCDSDSYLREVCRYIALNPPRAGVCALPEDWPLAGYRATVGLEYPREFHSPDKLLRLFGSSPQKGLAEYRDFVLSGHVSEGRDPTSDVGVNAAT